MIPVETFQFTTGLKGGIAGGIAMIVPATIYSLAKYHSIWYATNLMAAGGFVSWADKSDQFLAQFHMQGLLAALAIHARGVAAGGPAVRRDAADVSAVADFDGWVSGPASVDGPALVRARRSSARF